MNAESGSPGLSTFTSTSLLEGLRSPDNRAVWQQFDARYRPVIVGIARRRGLNEADAEDAAQKALVEFYHGYQQGKYDRAKGRLRHWLFGIARNQIGNTVRHVPNRELQAVDTSSQTNIFERQPDPEDDARLEKIETEEWQKGVYQECLAQVRLQFDARTVEAFELFAWQGLPAQEVAERLGITTNAVFLAKHKIVKRIRETLPKIEEIW